MALITPRLTWHIYSGLMLLLSLPFSSYRSRLLNLIGIPVAAVGLIAGFSFSQHNLFINQKLIGLDIHIILSLSVKVVLLMGNHSLQHGFETKNSKTNKNVGFG